MSARVRKSSVQWGPMVTAQHVPRVEGRCGHALDLLAERGAPVAAFNRSTVARLERAPVHSRRCPQA